jgi:apolipoprotein N-acyltransferase
MQGSRVELNFQDHNVPTKRNLSMETLKHGLALTALPFFSIFMLFTVWWALVDMSVEKVKGRQRTMWTLLVVLLPPIGTLLYVLCIWMQKEREAAADSISDNGLLEISGLDSGTDSVLD